MPKASRGGRRAVAKTLTPTQQNIATKNYTAPSSYSAMTDTDVQQLRNLQDSAYNGSVTSAVKMYIAGASQKAPTMQVGGANNIDGLGHSLSQALNYALENDVDIANMSVQQYNKMMGTNLNGRAFASMQYTASYLDAGAHPIGKDVTLTRACHDDILKNEFGISNYSNMSEAQLKSKLVGGTYTNKAYLSTAYDAKKSPFLNSNSGVSGGREVIFKYSMGKDTKVLIGNKAQSEIIVNKGYNWKIKDVRYTNQTATPKGKGARPQIIIEVERY